MNFGNDTPRRDYLSKYKVSYRVSPGGTGRWWRGSGRVGGRGVEGRGPGLEVGGSETGGSGKTKRWRLGSSTLFDRYGRFSTEC